MSVSGPSPEIFSPEFFQDPYTTFSWLREHAPVYEFQSSFNSFPMWIVTRYDDVRSLLADPRFSSNTAAASSEFQAATLGIGRGTELEENVTLLDPPDHTRVRNLAMKGFSPRRVNEWREVTQRIAESLLDELKGHTEVDLMTQYAAVVPAQVLGHILGIPPDMRTFVVEQTEILGSFDQRAQEAAQALCEVGRGLVAERRRQSSDDFLMDLIEAHTEHMRLSDTELVAMVTTLLTAGFDATRNMIGNAVLGLIDHPAQRVLLHERPDIIASATEELLRYDGPFLVGAWRFAREPVELAGVMLPAGGAVIPAITAANRDPAKFDAPDQLNLTRPNNVHLAFGHGIHHCMGAALARLLSQVALPCLMNRFPDFDLAVPRSQIRFRDSFITRGATALPIALGRPSI